MAWLWGQGAKVLGYDSMVCFFQLKMEAHRTTMRNHICWNHIALQLKLKKQLTYNFFCNYPFKNTMY
jgi:hypothetical protein